MQTKQVIMYFYAYYYFKWRNRKLSQIEHQNKRTKNIITERYCNLIECKIRIFSHTRNVSLYFFLKRKVAFQFSTNVRYCHRIGYVRLRTIAACHSLEKSTFLRDKVLKL